MSKAIASGMPAKDILSIQQLQARFAMAFDEILPNPAAAWASTFTSDGEFVLMDSSCAVQKKAKGTKELMALHGELADPAVRHWYGNILIEPEPEGARMQCYFISLDTKTLAVRRTAVYYDTLMKIGGEWKLKKRTVTLDAGSS
jgi:SnoaL-like domain